MNHIKYRSRQSAFVLRVQLPTIDGLRRHMVIHGRNDPIKARGKLLGYHPDNWTMTIEQIVPSCPSIIVSFCNGDDPDAMSTIIRVFGSSRTVTNLIMDRITHGITAINNGDTSWVSRFPDGTLHEYLGYPDLPLTQCILGITEHLQSLNHAG